MEKTSFTMESVGGNATVANNLTTNNVTINVNSFSLVECNLLGVEEAGMLEKAISVFFRKFDESLNVTNIVRKNLYQELEPEMSNLFHKDNVESGGVRYLRTVMSFIDKSKLFSDSKADHGDIHKSIKQLIDNILSCKEFVEFRQAIYYNLFLGIEKNKLEAFMLLYTSSILSEDELAGKNLDVINRDLQNLINRIGELEKSAQKEGVVEHKLTEDTFNDLQSLCDQLKKKNVELKTTVEKSEKFRVSKNSVTVEDLFLLAQNIRKSVAVKNESLKHSETYIVQLKANVEDLKGKLSISVKQLADLKKNLITKESEIELLKGENQSLSGTVQDLEYKLSAYETKLRGENRHNTVLDDCAKFMIMESLVSLRSLESVYFYLQCHSNNVITFNLVNTNSNVGHRHENHKVIWDDLISILESACNKNYSLIKENEGLNVKIQANTNDNSMLKTLRELCAASKIPLITFANFTQNIIAIKKIYNLEVRLDQGIFTVCFNPKGKEAIASNDILEFGNQLCKSVGLLQKFAKIKLNDGPTKILTIDSMPYHHFTYCIHSVFNQLIIGPEKRFQSPIKNSDAGASLASNHNNEFGI